MEAAATLRPLILVVESSESSLDSLATALITLGGVVLRAHSGPAALQTAITCGDELAVVVVAAQMPGMSGYECVELLREQPRFSSVPVIFVADAVTGGERQQLRGGEHGPVDYICRPVDGDALRSKVSACVASRWQAKHAMVRDQRPEQLVEQPVEHQELAEHQRLVEQERLATLGTTVATFAHEVGNLINNMYLQAQLLERQLAREEGGEARREQSREIARDRAAAEASKRKRLRLIMGEMQRLTVLLDEFRELARRQDCELVETPLAAVVAEALQMQRPAFRAQNVKVVEELEASPAVKADRAKLIQVLLNLSKNALEAMPKGGTLTVTVLIKGAEARLRISDTGMGIPDNVAILEPFTTTKRLGTGLGLPVVRQIVAAHAGRLCYESEPGVGTTFEISLPLALPPDGSRADANS